MLPPRFAPQSRPLIWANATVTASAEPLHLVTTHQPFNLRPQNLLSSEVFW